MQTKLLSREAGTEYALVFEKGDEVVSHLTAFARKEKIRCARFTGIGAFESATLAYFDWETKEYLDIPVNEQVEVLVFAGDITQDGDQPMAHIHVVLGRRDGTTIGGHLRQARVRPTLELMLTRVGALKRKYDPASGLALIAPDA